MDSLQYGANITLEEKISYESIFCKYIHVFAFSYENLQYITTSEHIIDLQDDARIVSEQLYRMTLGSMDPVLRNTLTGSSPAREPSNFKRDIDIRI